MRHSQLFFHQDCPVCGRKMRIRIEWLGKQISCAHCNAVTVACDDTDVNAMLTHSPRNITSDRWRKSLC
jgi:hypothetical protein